MGSHGEIVQPEAPPIHSDDLGSDRGIDYTSLRNLLQAGKWQEADQETARKMCKVMGRQKEGWLRTEDIEQFPCRDLRTIDRLWVEHSWSTFGFSVQKTVWQQYGSPTEHDKQWEKFGEAVAWRIKGQKEQFKDDTTHSRNRE